MKRRPFKKGDVVYHKQMPSMEGTVSYLKGPIDYDGRPSYQVYWKGWNPFNPEQQDYTWDFALELVQQIEHRV